MAEVHGSCDERLVGVREALGPRLDRDELGTARTEAWVRAAYAAVS